MAHVLEVVDKTRRMIYLTDERYKHILKHPEMQNKLDEIRKTIEKPLKVTEYHYDNNIKLYYSYHKNTKLKAKCLRVIVKYLNGNGFIVTAFFVDKIK